MGGAVPPLPQYALMAWCSEEPLPYVTYFFNIFKHKTVIHVADFEVLTPIIPKPDTGHYPKPISSTFHIL
jgi:hypothetical protein